MAADQQGPDRTTAAQRHVRRAAMEAAERAVLLRARAFREEQQRAPLPQPLRARLDDGFAQIVGDVAGRAHDAAHERIAPGPDLHQAVELRQQRADQHDVDQRRMIRDDQLPARLAQPLAAAHREAHHAEHPHQPHVCAERVVDDPLHALLARARIARGEADQREDEQRERQPAEAERREREPRAGDAQPARDPPAGEL